MLLGIDKAVAFEEKSLERQNDIIGYRFDTTGIFGYSFYSESGNICSVSSIVAPSAPVLIHGDGVTWRSEFDDCMTIVPGIARSINDESNGTQLYRSYCRLLVPSRSGNASPGS